MKKKFQISRGLQERMTGVPIIVKPQCLQCKHWILSGSRCNAFPDGIPSDFLLNVLDHRFPIEGDHGVIFSPTESNVPLK